MNAMYSRVCIVIALASTNVTGHGTVTKPAMRQPAKGKEYCPWCQGSQNRGNNPLPPSPCWGDVPGTMVAKKYFGKKYKDVVDSDGAPWIVDSQQNESIPIWCPGDAIRTHTLVTADHNGVYRWESQLAAPGKETESAFKNFTSWKSVNQDPDTDFYASDGTSKLLPGKCYPPGRCETWTPKCGHCRNSVFSKTTLTLPSTMPAGPIVLRWFWYGAMTTGGERVTDGPEQSLFVNCKDIVVGTVEQCQPTPSPPPTPAPPPTPSPPTPPPSPPKPKGPCKKAYVRCSASSDCCGSCNCSSGQCRPIKPGAGSCNAQ
jgi:hypothetical protein